MPLTTILIIILILCLLGYGGGRINPGWYANAPYLGNGFGGIGLIVVVILIVLFLL